MPQRRNLSGRIICDRFIGQNFPRRYVPAAVKSAFASASFNRDTIAAAPKPEKSGRKIPPILMIASMAITISGTIGMNHADGVAFAESENAEGVRHAIDLIAQFFVGDLRARCRLQFRFDGQLLIDLRVRVFYRAGCERMFISPATHQRGHGLPSLRSITCEYGL